MSSDMGSIPDARVELFNQLC